MTDFDDITTGEIHKNIENAKRLKNPMAEMVEKNELCYTAPSGAVYRFVCRSKVDMKPKTIKWCFKLAERNVAPFYKKLEMGWMPKVKRNDLHKKWSRFLVAYDKSNNPVAYSMFRFDLDYGHSVLYCYEIHIEPSFQRQGLGKFIMDTLEKCGKQRKMERVVLTVLKNNPNGQAFFRALGYKLDHSSPSASEKAEYEILSKDLSRCLF